MTTKSFQQHPPCVSFPLPHVNKQIVSNAAISFRRISAYHCCFHLLFSLLTPFEQLHSPPGRGGFLYDVLYYTDKKIGSWEDENAFNRGEGRRGSEASSRSTMFKTRPIGGGWSEVRAQLKWNMLWWMHFSKAAHVWWRWSAWFRFILCDVFWLMK